MHAMLAVAPLELTAGPTPLCVQTCRARDARRSTEPEDGQLQEEAELFSLFEEELGGNAA